MEQLRLLKDTAFTLFNLLVVRLKIARIELIELKNSLIKAIVMLIIALIMFFLSFISVLFGLDAILMTEQKIWVFFGIAATCFVLTIILFMFALSKLNASQQFMQETLQGIRGDLEITKGRKNGD